MAVRQIRIIGDDLLKKKSREVTEIDDKIRQLLDDMLDTLHQTGDGIGLAAPQVGVLKRVIVVDLSNEEEGVGPYKLINPVIIKRKGEQVCREGCLSIPGKLGDVTRPKEVTVEALNENGEKVVLKAKDLLAVVLCHEIDHLDGVLFVDRATELFDADEEEQ